MLIIFYQIANSAYIFFVGLGFYCSRCLPDRKVLGFVIEWVQIALLIFTLLICPVLSGQ